MNTPSRARNESPILLPQTGPGRRRVNGPEIALWIIGIVLLLASGFITYSFIQLIRNQTNQTSGPDDLSFFVAFTQSTTVFTPGLVTAGILCIALALLMRGLDINARRRMISAQAEEAEPGPAAIAPAANSPAPAVRIPVAPVNPGPTDYAPFMRPPGGSTDVPQ